MVAIATIQNEGVGSAPVDALAPPFAMIGLAMMG